LKWSADWRRVLASRERDERSEEETDLRDVFIRSGVRVAGAFALLFGVVFCAFWWSGKAVEFGAARAGGRAVPTWRVSGLVRDARTRQPVPWAAVADDSGGRPPLYGTDADYAGRYQLFTLAEPHRVRISAPGYRTVMVRIGRAWFLWLPRGEERLNVDLEPE